MSLDANYILVYDNHNYVAPTPMEKDMLFLREKHGGEFGYIDNFTIFWEKPKYTINDEDINNLLCDQLLERRNCENWKIIKGDYMQKEEEKFTVNLQTYQIICRACQQDFDGRTDAYENHVCFESLKNKKIIPEIPTSKIADLPLPENLRDSRIAPSASSKIPYCCPICLGDGYKINNRYPMADKLPCNGCATTGIVWG